MKKLVWSSLFPLLALITQQTGAANIVSTTQGGMWNATSTWVGGVVPTQNDDVFMVGPVSLNITTACKNMTVHTSGLLENYGTGHTLTINGNLVNDGILRDQMNQLNLTVHGNLEFRGTTTMYKIEAVGAASQTIYLQPGKILDLSFFTKSAGNLTALSNLSFYDTEVDFNHMQLILQPGSVAEFHGAGVNRVIREITIIGNNSTLITTNGYCGQMFTGENLTVEGTFKIYSSDVVFTGNTILNGTFENSGGSHEVQIAGNFTNNGIIQNGMNSLTVSLFSDVSSYGSWTNTTTNLAGTFPQNIWFSETSIFGGSYLTYTGLSYLNFTSDIIFRNSNINFNYCTVNCTPGIYLELTGGSQAIRNGNLIGNNSTMLLRGIYAQSISGSDFTLRGMLQIGDNNCVFTNTVLLDTLLNYGSGHNVWFHGDFTNTGRIENGTNTLVVYCSGDVWNYGEWGCINTYLNGSSIQNLTFSPGNVFTGTNFQYSGSASTIMVNSDLHFKGTNVNLNNRVLQMPDNTWFTVEGSVKNCSSFTLNGNNIHVKGIGSPYLQNIVINGDVFFDGLIRIGDNNVTINGGLTVNDTLANYGSGHSLYINGDLINYGVITNIMNSLTTNISGNLLNDGIFSNYENNISGGSDEHIRLMPGKPINKPIKLYSNLGGNGWVWYKNDLPIPGATAPILTLSTVSTANYGVYYCISSAGRSRNITIQEHLQAAFTSDAPLMGSSPLQVQFTDESSGGFTPYQYLWSFGDGNESFDENPFHEYTQPGLYNVLLTITDGFTESQVLKESHVFVCTQPFPDFSTENICIGEMAYFSDESLNLNLKDSLIIRYASSVINFSSEWNPVNWGAIQALGEPDVYPAHIDSVKAWAPLTPNGPREWIELGYDDPAPVSAVWIYETLRPGSVDTVYVKNPVTGLWEIVWSGSAIPAPLEARIFTIEFPETSYPVSEIRIAMNTGMVTYWNEIDAVALVSNKGLYPSEETVYEWDIDNDGITDYSTKGSVSHNYSLPGMYDVRLKIVNNGVCEDEIVKTLSVNTQPEIILNPADKTVCTETEAVFIIEAVMTGDYGISYQWFGPWGMLSGENQPELIINPATEDNAGGYYVVVYNACGYEISDTATLTIQQNPDAFAGEDATICENETFSSDLATAHYYEYLLWETTGTGTFDNPGLLNPVYTPSPEDFQSGLIMLTLTAFAENPCIINALSVLDLTLWLLPQINGQSTGTALCEGLPYQLEIIATGTNPLFYHWYGPQGLIEDVIENTLNFVALSPEDEGEYYCVVSNNCDEIYSLPVYIQVFELPEFDVQPANVTVQTGEDAVFSVEISGEEPLSLQWYGLNGLLEGENGTDLIIPKVNFLSQGNFYCIAENFCSAVQSGTVSLEVLSGGINQTVFVDQGWSGISTCLWMNNPTVSEFFEPYLSQLVILHDDEQMFWPEAGINTIGLWNNQQGYKIKVTDAVEMVFEGSIENDKTLQMYAGWNLIPVLSQCSVDAEDLFSGVPDDLVLVKDVAGTGVYWPEFSINNLINLIPGKAYFVLMENDAEITFADCSEVKDETFRNQRDRRQINENFPWSLPVATPNTHTVVITGSPANNLLSDSWIGAFDKNGKCFGICQWQGKSAVLTLFGDDSYTEIKDGFGENEPFLLKSFNPETKAEFVLEADFDLNFQQNSFVTHGLSVIRSLKTGFSESSLPDGNHVLIYPNPAKDKIFIQGLAGEVQITILDNRGAVMVGHRTSTPVETLNISTLPQGIYFVEISLAGNKVIRRFVKL